MSVLGRIWGGKLQKLDIDVAGHTACLVVSTLTHGVEDTCEIICTGIREIRLFDESPIAWEYVEITSASAIGKPDGSVVLQLTMWTEDAGLVIRCNEIKIDEEVLSIGGG